MMNKKFLFSSLFIAVMASGQVRHDALKHKTNLDIAVAESSGLLFIDGTLWTFNDSGGEAELYAVDTSCGGLIRKVTIVNASNNDWEALACDDNYVYIGDVGNNAGRRDRLCIYRVSRKLLGDKNVTLLRADTIALHYLKQHGKKAVMHKSMYDCEAMFCLNDSVFIISKNWLNQSMAIVYAIPAVPGYYKVSPYSYLQSDGLICDASVSPDRSTLAVVGYKDFMPFLSIYKIKSANPLILEKIHDTEFAKYHGLQTEGITFINSKDILISCEKNKFFPNALYGIIK